MFRNEEMQNEVIKGCKKLKTSQTSVTKESGAQEQGGTFRRDS